MGRGLTHLISIKGLNSLSCIEVGSCTWVFHCLNDIFRMGFPVGYLLSDKGQTFQNKTLGC